MMQKIRPSRRGGRRHMILFGPIFSSAAKTQLNPKAKFCELSSKPQPCTEYIAVATTLHVSLDRAYGDVHCPSLPSPMYHPYRRPQVPAPRRGEEQARSLLGHPGKFDPLVYAGFQDWLCVAEGIS